MLEMIPFTGLFQAFLFGALGMFLAIAGYFIFDWVDTKIDYNEEIRKGNIAAAIVLASFILGLCWIVARAIGG